MDRVASLDPYCREQSDRDPGDADLLAFPSDRLDTWAMAASGQVRTWSFRKQALTLVRNNTKSPIRVSA